MVSWAQTGAQRTLCTGVPWCITRSAWWSFVEVSLPTMLYPCAPHGQSKRGAPPSHHSGQVTPGGADTLCGSEGNVLVMNSPPPPGTHPPARLKMRRVRCEARRQGAGSASRRCEGGGCTHTQDRLSTYAYPHVPSCTQAAWAQAAWAQQLQVVRQQCVNPRHGLSTQASARRGCSITCTAACCVTQRVCAWRTNGLGVADGVRDGVGRGRFNRLS